MKDGFIMAYDSTQDTLNHIARVRSLLVDVATNLLLRSENHDLSKLRDPEKSAFDEFTPKLKASTYGSDEYKGFLAQMNEALSHHYAENSHHPEHYKNGIDGMSMLDLIEMFCDWKAATERHADGSIERSIKLNKDRFNMSEQLVSIFENTRKELGF